MTKYFVDAGNKYIGGFDGAEPPEGAIEVPMPPADARQMWNGSDWEPLKVEEQKTQRELDKEEVIAKIDDIANDQTIPKKVREVLVALKNLV